MFSHHIQQEKKVVFFEMGEERGYGEKKDQKSSFEYITGFLRMMLLRGGKNRGHKLFLCFYLEFYSFAS